MDVYLTMWGPSEFTISGKLRDFDISSELHKIPVPVLLTCGDRDEAGVKSVKDFQMEFPDAQMAVIPETAHLHQIEKPELYKAVVKDFIRKL
jgi:proline iminopeptidase